MDIVERMKPYSNGECVGNEVMRDALSEIESLRAQLAQYKQDAERLDYLNRKSGETVVRLAATWYWRKGYGRSHIKVGSVREAIDEAMKEVK